MGNIFQCCRGLLSFFKHPGDPVQQGAEQSPLLSSEESDLDSLDDSMINPSTGIANPALEPEHFLFPDIILSSNPAGEVTLVEPMVCLLVSEEDEAQGDEGDAREGRDRCFSEVETQTEVETQISAEVQTQTDSEPEIQTENDKDITTSTKVKSEMEKNIKLHEESAAGFVWPEQHQVLIHPSGNGSERTEHFGAERKSNNTHEDFQVKHELSDEDPGVFHVKNEIIHTDELVDEPIFNKTHMKDPENIKREKEDQDKSGLQPLSEEEPLFKGVASGTSEDELSNKRKTLPSDGEVADLHEDKFTVQIQPPGTESFDLQVSGQMSISELHQVLMDHELTCHRSCFSLQLGGAILDSATELGSIQGIQEGALIRVVEDSYSVRDVRVHLRHVRNLLRSLDLAGRSLSYLSLFTRAHPGSDNMEKDSVSRSPPFYILPGCKERRLIPLQPIRDDWKPLQCLRVLNISSWNPPPGNRKLHGDLMYISILTMEERELSITCCTRGFYRNQSTAFNFNPKPAAPKILCHSLVELLSQLSPSFRKNFAALQKRRVYQHPYECIRAPVQVCTWVAPAGGHSLDCVTAEETAGQIRGWNEELQRSRELPRASLQERRRRDRRIFRINSDFVAAAAQGAVSMMEGNVMPLNPGEPHHLHIFVWNNLFFSQGFDMSDHYAPVGGDAAAHAAAMCDLRGVQAYASVDTEGLHTLGTAVVDYRGVRVTAQTVVPGLLEKNLEQIVYGSNDNGKTVFTHPRFLDLLDESSKSLRIQPHWVLDHSGSPVELRSAISTVGIFGSDGRPYILDLLRTFPPDLNFLLSAETQQEVPAACRSFGFPRRHRHGLASLRPQLVEAFVQHRYELFAKMASDDLGHQFATEKPEEPQRAAGVRFPSECLPDVQRQRRLLWDAAAFLLSNQIPVVLRDCLDHTAVPMDGATLTSAIHQRGVNVRYLGAMLKELDKMEERERLSHVQRISISEVITRSAKHIFRTYMKDVEPAAFSAAVSHFLNCLLSSSSAPVPDSCSDELPSRRRSRRRRTQSDRANVPTSSLWAKLTSDDLWIRIKMEAEDYYHYTFKSESIEEEIEKHNLQKISLLRETSIKTGIQLQLREYVFECRHKPAFSEDDVVNMFPVVKHLKPTSTDAAGLVQQAQLAAQQGFLRAGVDLLGRALTLFSSVCGMLHEDVSMCLRLLGRLRYTLGENDDALVLQEKAVLISERIQGTDHPQTIQDYTHLALYFFAGGRWSTSLQLLYRARYLTLLVIGEDHPQIALLDSMLGLVLHALMENELSLKFLQNALTLTSKYHGAKSLKHAHSHHVLTIVYESKGEFHLALQHEKEAYIIYKNQLGESSDSTKESSEYLQRLTDQGMILQRAIRHVASGKPSASVSPPRLPSHPVILQQLNLTCGITFIPPSEKELRAELNERRKVQTEDVEYQLLNQNGNKQQL
ncbi:clustered mitochondria protein homolog isoform X2 [Xiphophorus hellerii]|uniref:clustered mitochondria protein homolog isoform X2 n=1 Tax=Xiphophorus hellerii TaxID=8084 RepID=UPI0013B3E595|nr:clustered mitochondria protein homolog isoform X2 [Xiphophorus hellerii]